MADPSIGSTTRSPHLVISPKLEPDALARTSSAVATQQGTGWSHDWQGMHHSTRPANQWSSKDESAHSPYRVIPAGLSGLTRINGLALISITTRYAIITFYPKAAVGAIESFMNNSQSTPSPNFRTMAIYLIFGIGFIVLWVVVMPLIFPEKPIVVRPTQETAALMLGGMATGTQPVNQFKRTGKIESAEQLAAEKKREEEEKAQAKKDAEIKAKEPPPKPTEPFELIALGHGEKPYYLQVLLNTLGGSVQQVILTEFPEADREGLMVKRDGKSVPEPLIPGTHRGARWLCATNESIHTPNCSLALSTIGIFSRGLSIANPLTRCSTTKSPVMRNPNMIWGEKSGRSSKSTSIPIRIPRKLSLKQRFTPKITTFASARRLR